MRTRRCTVPNRQSPGLHLCSDCSYATAAHPHPTRVLTEMLHEFLTSNRTQLIQRCRAKVAKRFAPAELPAAMDHGVPLFLEQLVDTLRIEQLTLTRSVDEPEPTPTPSELGRAAA